MARARIAELDPITLEIFWNRLIAICDQAAATLVRTAFSTIIRESNDFTVVLLDTQGDSLAENRGTIGSFAGCLPRTMKHLLRSMPVETWRPGDVVMSNDPWIGTGHRPDITVIAPVFHRGRLVAFAGTTGHWADIGGVIFSADTHSVFEEGIGIPPMKLFSEGQLDTTLLELIRYNVRVPDMIMGDLFAQIAGAEACGQLTAEFMDEYGLEDLDLISQMTLERAEAAMRRAIRQVPPGVYRSAVPLDGFDHPLQIQCTIDVRGEEIEVDFSGTSPQIDRGSVNCVSTYTSAWTSYALKCALDPASPKNEGSYRPITAHAPEGTILNCTSPAPVNARHLIGRCICSAVLTALAPVLPEKVIAECGSTPDITSVFEGVNSDGRRFTFMLMASGGMGASFAGDGLACTSYPANVGAASIEIMESITPLLVWKKEMRQNSGGAGKFRGGPGQDIDIEIVSPAPLTLSVLADRTIVPAQGLFEGQPGAPIRVRKLNEEQGLPTKGRVQLLPGDVIRLSHGGGGGYGPPEERDLGQVQDDLRNELISEGVANTLHRLRERLAQHRP